jgi:HopJ type III effector protein
LILVEALNMTLAVFIEKIHNNTPVTFNETISVISDNYHYTATEFSNGLAEHLLVNEAGTNEGSCKIFAFAGLHELDQQQTLNLFGDYYRVDVLNDPQGTGHQNIRNFMADGWAGISFKGEALRAL